MIPVGTWPRVLDRVPEVLIDWLLNECGIASFRQRARAPYPLPQPGVAAAFAVAGDLSANLCLLLPDQTATGIASLFRGRAIAFESSSLIDTLSLMVESLRRPAVSQFAAEGQDVRISPAAILRTRCVAEFCRYQKPRATERYLTDFGPLWLLAVTRNS